MCRVCALLPGASGAAGPEGWYAGLASPLSLAWNASWPLWVAGSL